MSVVWKLVTLIAVLLMPFGMTAAPAAATQHHSASMPMEHCPDQAPNPDMKPGFEVCTMACSAALPAADLSGHEVLTIICEPFRAANMRQPRGLHPDPATPAPKRS